MKTLCVMAVVAAAGGIANAEIARSFDVINTLDITTSNAFSAHDANAPRTITTGSSYNASAGWGDGTGYAPVVLDGGGAAVAHNGTFDGIAEPYAGGAANQLGDTWGVAEFQGTSALSGNDYVQLSFFSTTGTTLDAYAATGGAYSSIGMAAGVGFFVSEGQDSFDVAESGFTFEYAEFGFFDLSGGFLGAADITATGDFSDASGLGAIGALNAFNAGIAGNIGEMYIYIEYSTVPAPASAALMGLGGLVAIRRRR